ncbi:zinc ABC transporter substrate-binding protein [Corynebacterium urealyticum]|uniref:ABC transport system, substrate-binding protein n=1 Tax=Corynebacterium urealyticum (strain ATCC 43042 / DSM 7109) TaxID=504474 RepID=B1VH66_CORU7|nr:metal ABC transporter substrate-binding protein [Corynebacterium urealyticum]AGE36719.1 ABC transport system, substrate-binding protein [Corynebacterium urealyticum DSM 7111]QQB08347.1 zinc ABC transporter substrate-binding protein [Corynebacterium urealyticum]QQC41465.1 zinc ABC transporter substrate-binding protein [Corynebacterium urealyticum]QQE50089.1 zinc ABC transporter substrate-binding protein [Corynebacterium urealyticum]TYR16179.1 zinc ABC transporter substrate-binding protein [C
MSPASPSSAERPAARPRRPFARALTAAIGLTIAGASLVACSSEGEPSGSDDQIKVVASTTQICDYVKQMDLSEVDLTCLLAPNASAHELEMTHEQLKATSEAELLLVNGVDLEHFLSNAIESSGFKGNMLVTTGVLTASDVKEKPKQIEDAANGDYKIDRGIEQVDVAPWPFPPEEPGEEAEFTYDPHVWTSPKNAKVQVANIGYALEKIADERGDEAMKKAISEGVKSYQDKLDDLDEWTRESFATVKDPVLFTSHDAFGYLSKEYGIDFIGAALSDFSDQQDATADHIRKAAETVRKSGATALFAENSNNSKSIEAIAKAAGVKAVVGDDALYGDSLGPAGSAGETYISSIIHNVTTLVEAWDGKLADLPESLK